MLEIKPLASERVRVGMTQEEAAARLGCSAKSLCFYENHVRDMPAEVANSAADLYGCSKASIFESIEAVRKKVKKYWMRCPDE